MTTSKRTPRRAGSSAQSENGAAASAGSPGTAGVANGSPPKAKVRRAKPSAPKKRASSDDRLALIAKAAYFRSQHRGFQPGHELEDWLAAEAEVDQTTSRAGRASARR